MRLLLMGSLKRCDDYLLEIVEFLFEADYKPAPPKNTCFKQSVAGGRALGSHAIIMLIKSKAYGVAIGITFYKLCNTKSLFAVTGTPGRFVRPILWAVSKPAFQLWGTQPSKRDIRWSMSVSD